MKKSELRRIIREEITKLKDGGRILAKKGKYKVYARDGFTSVLYNDKPISLGYFHRGADGWFMNITGYKGEEFFDTADGMLDYFNKNRITK